MEIHNLFHVEVGLELNDFIHFLLEEETVMLLNLLLSKRRCFFAFNFTI